MISLKTTFLFISLLFYVPSLFCLSTSDVQKLNQRATNKATVGMILVYQYKDYFYILLGRERCDGKGRSAGKFSDLGGKASTQTFFKELLRELKEESMGFIKLSEKEVMDKGELLEIKKQNGHQIYYVLYPLPARLYVPGMVLTKIRHLLYKTSKISKIPKSYFEKDIYLWVRMNDLKSATLKKPTVKVDDIQGKKHVITLRKSFLTNCLLTPAFKKALMRIISYSLAKETMYFSF